MRFLPQAIAGLVIAASPLSAAPAPSVEQIAAFEHAFTTAWKARDIPAIKRLMALDGVPESSVDLAVFFWEEIARNSQKNEEWGGIKFETLEEALGPDPRRNLDAIRSMIEEKTVNGRKYIQNLPVSGIVSLYLWGKSSSMQPLGLDRDGTLKLTQWIPEGGASEADRLPRPLKPQGFATKPPSPEAIARLCAAIEETVATKAPWAPLLSPNGAPQVEIDLNAGHYALAFTQGDEKTLSTKFIPLETMFAEGSRYYQRTNYQPHQRNGRWYGFNLPLAGVITVEQTGKHHSTSLTLPVGSNAEGAVQIIFPVPLEGNGE